MSLFSLSFFGTNASKQKRKKAFTRHNYMTRLVKMDTLQFMFRIERMKQFYHFKGSFQQLFGWFLCVCIFMFWIQPKGFRTWIILGKYTKSLLDLSNLAFSKPHGLLISCLGWIDPQHCNQIFNGLLNLEKNRHFMRLANNYNIITSILEQ